MTAPVLPEDLLAIRRDLDQNSAQARELLHGLSDEQVNWQPDGGRAWSIAQCLDHLVAANRAYRGAMLPAAAAGLAAGRWRQGPIRQGPLQAWFTRWLEPPPRRRVPAPPSIVPASRQALVEVQDAFARTQQELRDDLEAWAALDFNRVRFRNPLLPLVRLSLGSGFRIINAHERRHLWQAGRVRAAPGFP
jgi:hypothetical protein